MLYELFVIGKNIAVQQLNSNNYNKNACRMKTRSIRNVQLLQFPWGFTKLLHMRSHFPEKNHYDSTSTEYDSVHTLENDKIWPRVDLYARLKNKLVECCQTFLSCTASELGHLKKPRCTFSYT